MGGWISICIAAVGLLIPRAVQAQDVEPARFHHLHLNVTDPERTLEFYQRIFGAMPVKFRGVSDALFTGRSFILLTQVDSPPSGEPDTGIWHGGWGGVDVPIKYDWLREQGVDIAVPIYRLGNGYVTYIRGPDGEWIEVNTQGHRRFSHIHMIASDVNATAQWYTENLGLPSRRRSRPKPEDWTAFHRAGSRAWSSGFRMANASVAIYNLPYYTPAPPWWPFEPLTELKPQRGRAIDHLAYSFRDIQPVFERMSNAGVEIVEPISVKQEYGMKSFFVMGPDNVVVEIVEAKPIPEGLWD